MALANRLACFVISSCSSRGYEAKMSYLVPIRTGIAVCFRSMFVRMRVAPWSSLENLPY